MRKVIFSLLTIIATVGVIGGAAYAYFSDRAVLAANTYATGVLEVRLNGQETLPGFNVTNAYPGIIASKSFTIQNYGTPWFAGPSTLDAKGLTATPAKTAGDQDLYDALTARLYANAGWGGCSNPGVTFVAGKGCTVFSGLLKDMNAADILNATQWGTHPALAHGNSLSMLLEVELVDSHTPQNDLQGKSTTFDLNVDAYSSWPL